MMPPALARGEAQAPKGNAFQTYQDFADYGDGAGYGGNYIYMFFNGISEFLAHIYVLQLNSW